MIERFEVGDNVEVLSVPGGTPIGTGVVKEVPRHSNPRARVLYTSGPYTGIETFVTKAHLRLVEVDFTPRFAAGEEVIFRGQRVWVDKYCPHFRTSGMARVIFVSDRHAAWVEESHLAGLGGA